MEQINLSGTWFQGIVQVSYNDLVKVLGEPDFTGCEVDKGSVEWSREHAGVIFTVYDYNWTSSRSDRPESFHVGGRDPEAVDTVKTLLGL